ncbi:RDD family protein [Ehrlichia chaffeensis str. Heartland]|uniref:RDD family protein n=1 Tax=Ehrlichia chaffeensis (strain ATCC CRL-10679 / Arkansas) TaxID=205920 RepID=Q2GHD2_EHRCR|nr:RDD family protein [Ehrlichia chaffeensis]ABD44704.1 RDD family protein [Ehrlichia chaffeensis str. Arkansas]AHX03446.1 RDD family protein [Ehrlichia chaffeensis str. Heartland]AHX05835.1 RDD family protein [Ehrlichia chaffeensis str. Jax]AHX06827.1 RDD family protein [Ehrlichia chaffeensis str. Liberty]AHX07932.1 RDD family protein [Ehrlichia chaffeensis str. Osceola]
MTIKKTKTANIIKRVLASIIDHVILSLLNYPIVLLTNDITIIPFIFNVLSSCYYYTYFLSSKTQASIGQKILNIHTIRCDHKKIDIRLAFDRSLSEFLCPTILMMSIQAINMNINNIFIVSIIFLITMVTFVTSTCWYLIALFSQKNQTLHDIMFNTMVVDNE